MSLTQDTFVRARVNKRLKIDTERIFNRLGFTTTDAIRIFLVRVQREKGLPFNLRLTEDNSDLLPPAARRQTVLDSFYDDETR